MQLQSVFKLIKRILFITLPIWLIISSLLIIDPYGFYLPLEKKQTALIPMSDDYIAFERYLSYTPKMHYNSFTFGNSKTLAYLTSDWKPHLKNARAFKFGVPGECIFNILNKLKLIDKKGDSIKNVLIVLDPKVFLNFKNTQKFFQGPAYLHHPYSTAGNSLEFYSSYLKYYFSDFAFWKVLQYKLTGHYQESMAGIFKNPDDWNTINAGLEFLPMSNEVINRKAEKEISDDSVLYFNNNRSKFGNRDSLRLKSQDWKIIAEDLEFLLEIKQIFDKHKTKYAIVLGPNFDQIPFSVSEKSKLEKIFNPENIYDFTGVNTITNCVSNYYEMSHYRIGVGKNLIDSIYAKH